MKTSRSNAAVEVDFLKNSEARDIEDKRSIKLKKLEELKMNQGSDEVREK